MVKQLGKQFYVEGIEVYNTSMASKLADVSKSTIAKYCKNGLKGCFKNGSKWVITKDLFDEQLRTGFIFQNKETEIEVWTEKALTKESSNNELTKYFKYIKKIHDQNGENFPVDFDLVWPLAYTRRSKAVEALKRNFKEDVDYISYGQNNGSKKHEEFVEVVDNQDDAHVVHGKRRQSKELFTITLKALEFFIARKNEHVFDVYRKVFHIATDIQRQSINKNDVVKMIEETVFPVKTQMELLYDKVNNTEMYLKDISQNTALMIQEFKNARALPLPEHVIVDKNMHGNNFDIDLDIDDILDEIKSKPTIRQVSSDTTPEEEAVNFLTIKKASKKSHEDFMKDFFILVRKSGFKGRFNPQKIPGQYFVDVARKGYINLAYEALK